MGLEKFDYAEVDRIMGEVIDINKSAKDTLDKGSTDLRTAVTNASSSDQALGGNINAILNAWSSFETKHVEFSNKVTELRNRVAEAKGNDINYESGNTGVNA